MMQEEVFTRLAAPFPEDEIEWRVQSSGESNGKPWVRVIAYIQNVAIMRRLDEVVGPANWQNEFRPIGSGVICGLSLRDGDGWVTKWDGASATEVEPLKGALSGAMKRAAVQWGIGRYLHDIGEQFAIITQDRDGRYLKANPQKHGAALRWKPPKLAAQFVASPAKPGRPEPEPARARPAATRPLAMFAHPMTARDVHAADYPLPGTKAHLAGHGGKAIGAVPLRDLPEVRRMLAEKGDRYATEVAAIDAYLAEQMGAGDAE